MTKRKLASIEKRGATTLILNLEIAKLNHNLVQ